MDNCLVEVVAAAPGTIIQKADGNFDISGGMLPAPPLEQLPFDIQRALVERRRYRFMEYGITPESWKSGTFSFFSIQDDPNWKPRQLIDRSGSAPGEEPRIMPERTDPIHEFKVVAENWNRGIQVINHLVDGRVVEIYENWILDE